MNLQYRSVICYGQCRSGEILKEFIIYDDEKKIDVTHYINKVKKENPDAILQARVLNGDSEVKKFYEEYFRSSSFRFVKEHPDAIV